MSLWGLLLLLGLSSGPAFADEAAPVPPATVQGSVETGSYLHHYGFVGHGALVSFRVTSPKGIHGGAGVGGGAGYAPLGQPFVTTRLMVGGTIDPTPSLRIRLELVGIGSLAINSVGGSSPGGSSRSGRGGVTRPVDAMGGGGSRITFLGVLPRAGRGRAGIGVFLGHGLTVGLQGDTGVISPSAELGLVFEHGGYVRVRPAPEAKGRWTGDRWSTERWLP